jgi:hypothetical protein
MQISEITPINRVFHWADLERCRLNCGKPKLVEASHSGFHVRIPYRSIRQDPYEAFDVVPPRPTFAMQYGGDPLMADVVSKPKLICSHSAVFTDRS